MDAEAIEKRLAELRDRLKQIEANGNATVGAIQECERWLAIVKQEAVKDGGSGSNPD